MDEWIAAGAVAVFAAGLSVGILVAQLSAAAAQYGKHSHTATRLPVAAAIAHANQPGTLAAPPATAASQHQRTIPYDALRDEIYCPTWDTPHTAATLAGRRVLLHRVLKGLRAPDWPTQPVPQVYIAAGVPLQEAS